MGVGNSIGGRDVGVGVFFGICVGVNVGETGNGVMVGGTVDDVMKTDCVLVEGNVFWTKGSVDILPGVQAVKLNPEINTKRKMRDFISWIEKGNRVWL